MACDAMALSREARGAPIAMPPVGATPVLVSHGGSAVAVYLCTSLTTRGTSRREHKVLGHEWGQVTAG